MTEKAIAEFRAQPESVQKNYLQRHLNNVEKAALAYQQDHPKQNTYYTGGAQSGLAVLAPPDDDSQLPQEEAPKPKEKPNYFAGPSHSLNSGNPAPGPQSQPIAPKRTDYTTPGAPKTKVRITFPDGQVLMLAVNLSATVADLKTYIAENRPDAQGKAISLNLTPANTPLDDSLTIEAGKLKMANMACTY